MFARVFQLATDLRPHRRQLLRVPAAGLQCVRSRATRQPISGGGGDAGRLLVQAERSRVTILFWVQPRTYF